jgi:hypothetical protein
MMPSKCLRLWLHHLDKGASWRSCLTPPASSKGWSMLRAFGRQEMRALVGGGWFRDVANGARHQVAWKMGFDVLKVLRLWWLLNEGAIG